MRYAYLFAAGRWPHDRERLQTAPLTLEQLARVSARVERTRAERAQRALDASTNRHEVTP